MSLLHGRLDSASLRALKAIGLLAALWLSFVGVWSKVTSSRSRQVPLGYVPPSTHWLKRKQWVSLNDGEAASRLAFRFGQCATPLIQSPGRPSLGSYLQSIKRKESFCSVVKRTNCSLEIKSALRRTSAAASADSSALWQPPPIRRRLWKWHPWVPRSRGVGLRELLEAYLVN